MRLTFNLNVFLIHLKYFVTKQQAFKKRYFNNLNYLNLNYNFRKKKHMKPERQIVKNKSKAEKNIYIKLQREKSI